MRTLFLTVIFSLFLHGCGTIQMNPPVHQLRETAIPDFQVKGEVEFINNQESSDPAIIHSYGGTKYQSDYKTITETMVSQAKLELSRHGKVSQGGEKKVIKLKVKHLLSKYIAFYWTGTMTYDVELGNGESFEKMVEHRTGANAVQDLSGSIADGVVALFKDERVLNYLAE